MEGSVARAVCVFSEGAHELVGLMNKMYMDISFDTLRLLAEKDERCMKKGDSAAQITSKCCEDGISQPIKWETFSTFPIVDGTLQADVLFDSSMTII